MFYEKNPSPTVHSVVIAEAGFITIFQAVSSRAGWIRWIAAEVTNPTLVIGAGRSRLRGCDVHRALQDAARHGADVGPAVPAHLEREARAAQRVEWFVYILIMGDTSG